LETDLSADLALARLGGGKKGARIEIPLRVPERTVQCLVLELVHECFKRMEGGYAFGIALVLLLNLPVGIGNSDSSSSSPIRSMRGCCFSSP
jgi:hypothetical protein